MSQPSGPEPARDDEAWEAIVADIGEDVFKDVPNIIATPARPATDHPVGTGREDFVLEPLYDDFVQPNPPKVRLSRTKRIAIAVFVCGPLLGYASTATGILDPSLGQTLMLALCGAGVSMFIFSTAGKHRPDDDDSAQI